MISALSDGEILAEVSRLRAEAANSPPWASLVTSIKHSQLVQRISELQDELRRRHWTPATSRDLTYGRGRRGRMAKA